MSPPRPSSSLLGRAKSGVAFCYRLNDEAVKVSHTGLFKKIMARLRWEVPVVCIPKCTKHCKLRHLHYLVSDINGHCTVIFTMEVGSSFGFWPSSLLSFCLLSRRPLAGGEERTDTDADYASSFQELQPERDRLWLHARLKADFSVTMRASVFLPLLQGYQLRKWKHFTICLGSFQ